MAQTSQTLVVSRVPSIDDQMKLRREQRDLIEKLLEAMKPEIERRQNELRLRQHYFRLRFSQHLGGQPLDVPRTKDILRTWFWNEYQGRPKFIEYMFEEGDWVIELYI